MPQSMPEAIETDEYRTFVGKFKPKKTTDDCYTPEPVFQAVSRWAVQEYGLHGREIVRPFWPGEDFEGVYYPPGCVVIDNPPFSILSKIERFYLKRGIDFFLFAPTLTLFNNIPGLTYIVCAVDVVYENGAKVNTSFVTNMDGAIARTAPKLKKTVEAVNKVGRKNARQRYDLPDCVITSARLTSIADVDFRVERSECVYVRNLDEMKAEGKSLFGHGFLLGKEAAKRHAAAKHVAAKHAVVWTLSEREHELLRALR